MAAAFIPARNDIVWLDFEPPKGREIGKYRPALVLSSLAYHQQTGLLICCPISTSIRGAPTEVPVHNLDQPCVVAANLIHTLDWRARQIKKAAEGEPGLMMDVLARLLPLIGADLLLQSGLDHNSVQNPVKHGEMALKASHYTQVCKSLIFIEHDPACVS